LLDGGLQITPDQGTIQVILVVDRDVADHFTAALQHSGGIGKQGAAVESEIHMIAIDGDMAEAIFDRLAGKRKRDADGITVGDAFQRVGRLFENNFAQRQGQIRDVRRVRCEMA
jgi:hypothetical protein